MLLTINAYAICLMFILLKAVVTLEKKKKKKKEKEKKEKEQKLKCYSLRL